MTNRFAHGRVCHLTSVHPWDDVRIFHKECATLAAAGLEVHLIAPGAPEARVKRVFVHGVPVGQGRLRRMTLTTEKVFKRAIELDVDVYHLHDPELIPVGLRLHARGKEVVYDAHEDYARDIVSKAWIPATMRRPVARSVEWLERHACRRFSGVVAATPTIGKNLAAASSNAVIVNNFPIDNELTNDATWDERESKAVYVGTIAANRGIFEIIAATARAQVPLLLAGSMSPETLLGEASATPGWTNTEYVGILDRAGVRKLLARARVGILTLHPKPNYLTSQPVKLFEYMAAGIPVVASDFPLWRQIITRAGCGLCVDPMNVEESARAIRHLIDNPTLAEQMGRRGREAVGQQYNWSTEARALVGLYDDILERRRAR